MKTRLALQLPAVALLLSLGCGGETSAPPVPVATPGADAEGHTAATPATVAANAAFAGQLPLADQQDFEDARRGLVASDPEVVVPGPPGAAPIWDTRAYGFVHGDAPDSVNPSLWRQAKLNGIHGLFEVADGVYQVRGYDLANMTRDPRRDRLDRGRSADRAGDGGGGAGAGAAPSRRRADRGGDLHAQPRRPLRRQSPACCRTPRRRQGVRIVAPRDFVEEATSENVLAGIAMGRRATFMYGMPLARSPRGHVDTGLGKEPARGTHRHPRADRTRSTTRRRNS